MILKKTSTNSFIKRFHASSDYAKLILDENGSYIVLQIMEMPDGWLIAEIIRRGD